MLVSLYLGVEKAISIGCKMGMGQNYTRKWTAGFSPWFNLPGQAILGLPYFLTHSQMSLLRRPVEAVALAPRELFASPPRAR